MGTSHSTYEQSTAVRNFDDSLDLTGRRTIVYLARAFGGTVGSHQAIVFETENHLLQVDIGVKLFKFGYRYAIRQYHKQTGWRATPLSQVEPCPTVRQEDLMVLGIIVITVKEVEEAAERACQKLGPYRLGSADCRHWCQNFASLLGVDLPATFGHVEGLEYPGNAGDNNVQLPALLPVGTDFDGKSVLPEYQHPWIIRS